MATHLANATGTVSVLEGARRASNVHVIVASSSSVYGRNPTLPKREDLVPLPVSPYAASKLATEGYALAYQDSFGVPVLAFRFFNVFGPGQAAGHAYAAVVPAFVTAALAGRPLVVHGDGTQSRDFTFVGTVSALIADALARRVTHPESVNLAFGTRTDILTLAQLVADAVGVELAVEHTAPRAGDVAHSQADSARAARVVPDNRGGRTTGRARARRSPGSARRCDTVTKRAFDLVGAGLLLVLLSPVFAVIALLVLVLDGSPVLFRQLRPGRDGRPFDDPEVPHDDRTS